MHLDFYMVYAYIRLGNLKHGLQQRTIYFRLYKRSLISMGLTMFFLRRKNS